MQKIPFIIITTNDRKPLNEFLWSVNGLGNSKKIKYSTVLNKINICSKNSKNSSLPKKNKKNNQDNIIPKKIIIILLISWRNKSKNK